MLTGRFNKLPGRNNSKPTGIPKAFSNWNKAETWTLGKANFAKRKGDPELCGAAAASSGNATPGRKQGSNRLRLRAPSLKAEMRTKNEVPIVFA